MLGSFSTGKPYSQFFLILTRPLILLCMYGMCSFTGAGQRVSLAGLENADATSPRAYAEAAQLNKYHNKGARRGRKLFRSRVQAITFFKPKKVLQRQVRGMAMGFLAKRESGSPSTRCTVVESLIHLC